MTMDDYDDDYGYDREATDLTTITVVPTGVETDKAIMVKVDEEEVWIPKSLIIEEELEEMQSMDEMFLTLPEWFVEKRGL